MIINVCDALALFFSGDESLDEALENATELFIKTFESEIFICKRCGKTIFPKTTVNEHGIFIESSRAEIRGGKCSRLVGNVCDECAAGIFRNDEV